MPLVQVLIFTKLYSRLPMKSYVDRIGSMYEGINLDKGINLMYPIFFTLRRSLFAVTLIYVREYPVF